MPFPKYLTRSAKLQVIAKKIAKWKQVRESQGVLANRVHEGERNQLPSNAFLHPLYRFIIEAFDWGYDSFLAPGSEILDKFNHQSNGNSISFLVGRNWRFPYPFAICVPLGPTNRFGDYLVHVDVNGFGIFYNRVFLEKSESCHLCFSSAPLYEWEKELNLSKQSHFKVTCSINCWNHREPMDPIAIIKKLGVHVECICCPHKSYVPNSLPLLPMFPTSCNEGDSNTMV